jgi:hypothetical protein
MLEPLRDVEHLQVLIAFEVLERQDVSSCEAPHPGLPPSRFVIGTLPLNGAPQ